MVPAMFDLTLSFDNGPTPEVTPFVLDVLARRGVKSTFFVIGEKLVQPENRALAERAHAEGHWIGNHTWSHSVPLGLMAADAAKAEFDRTQQAVGPLMHPHRFFRPYGQGGNLDHRLLSGDLVAHLARARATIVLWSALPRDWQDPDGWVERALGQVAAQPWSLMVLHDLPTGAMRHVDRFLGLVGDRGGRVQQGFPPDCMPMIDGELMQPLDRYLAA
jgi:peptidoglycan/xylan/chitin deacetylase (PgdA/CDA1 family)